MLVIRRHARQSILIGGAVEIEVMECGGNRVKLGIRAPKEIPVMRAEARQTREQNLAAAGSLAANRAGTRVGAREWRLEELAIQAPPREADMKS